MLGFKIVCNKCGKDIVLTNTSTKPNFNYWGWHNNIDNLVKESDNGLIVGAINDKYAFIACSCGNDIIQD